jgi:hypothetical protein
VTTKSLLLRASIVASFSLAFGQFAAAADPARVSSVPSFPDAYRGDVVTVGGHDLPAQGVKVRLRTGNEGATDAGTMVDVTVAPDGNTLTFKVPRNDTFATGRYLVSVVVDARELAVPGELRVLSDQIAPVHLDSIAPATAYPSDDDDGYDFSISGQNLAATPGDNVVEIVGYGPIVVGGAEDCKRFKSSQHYARACLSYDAGMETRRLLVTGFRPAHYQGDVDLRLRVRGNVSEVGHIVFSYVGAGVLRALAGIVSLIFALVVFLLLREGIHKMTGSSYSAAAAFFLDTETNSYSLSKFQLLAWTAVSVFGYLYLFFCRTLIQWRFEFPAVPSGMPALLGVSAGATVAAAGITANRGPKGAGATSPSMADFISSGGLVQGDRFQFFVWTLVGCVGFLVLVIGSDPSKLDKLPAIPDGFLYLMGISAAGYLGGKLVRLPGPVVRQVFVTGVVAPAPGAHASMTISLKGENLSSNARVKVDDDELRKDQFTLTPVTPQDARADPSFFSELNVTLTEADAYLEGVHTLALTNSDGQMAAAKFPVDALKVVSADAVPAGTAPANVTVRGESFGVGTTATWIDAAGAPSAIAADQIKRTSDSELVVTLTPGAAKGQGRLTLVSQIGLRASTPVTVTGA